MKHLIDHISSSVHQFSSFDDMNFSPKDYSMMKFGSDSVAKKFGCELAEDFFKKHSEVLLSSRCVVIPSPYNFVPNAATIMTKHFTNRLNHLLANANGEHIESSIIHRKVSYTNDYGFLSKEKRRQLIDNDSFYLNREFIKGKVLIFIDDVKITGTHEDKLVDILNKNNIKNKSFFLYYGEYKGVASPDIEGKLNFASMQSISDYLSLCNEPNHNLIVRPIKFLLGQPSDTLKGILPLFKKEFLEELYHACLGEGYYKIPSYQENFNAISTYVNKE